MDKEPYEKFFLSDDNDMLKCRSYSNEELETLVDGIIGGIDDTPAWKTALKKHGYIEARQILRNAIRGNGPNPFKGKYSMN